MDGDQRIVWWGRYLLIYLLTMTRAQSRNTGTNFGTVRGICVPSGALMLDKPPLAG